MRHIPHRLRAIAAPFLALALALVLAPLAHASWTGGGSGTTSALAYTMPSGGQPVTRTSGSSVTVQWATALFPDNVAVAGYVVKRFDATTGAQATVGAGCSGTVTTTTCTEQNVPSGTWIYTDTPVQDNWTGGQSAASAAVTVP
jgi:hypothetical protein